MSEFHPLDLLSSSLRKVFLHIIHEGPFHLWQSAAERARIEADPALMQYVKKSTPSTIDADRRAAGVPGKGW